MVFLFVIFCVQIPELIIIFSTNIKLIKNALFVHSTFNIRISTIESQLTVDHRTECPNDDIKLSQMPRGTGFVWTFGRLHRLSPVH